MPARKRTNPPGSTAPSEGAGAARQIQGKENQPRISVARFLDTFSFLDISVLAGRSGIEREIDSPRIQKPGLALAGFMENLHPGRVQVLGTSELAFLEGRTSRQRRAIARSLFGVGICCLLVTRSLRPPRELVDEAEATGTPLLQTAHGASVVAHHMAEDLSDLLAPVFTTHGVLVDIYGIGILIIGPGSIGKSETALDLIVRGHRLVSDDIVEIRRHGDILSGAAPELLRYHMELRGLGIINVKELFGVVATRAKKDVDLVVELEAWKQGRTYDRLGLDDQFMEIMGVPVPHLLIPVGPGRNISILLEVAVRNLMLKRRGVHSALDFAHRLQVLLGNPPDEI